MATLQLTYESIQKQIALLKGWKRDPAQWSANNVADADMVIRSGWAKFLRAHKWSFLMVRGSVETTAPYTTGTVEIVADPAGSIVTGTGTTFPTWSAGAELQVDGSRYLVKSRTSDTEIVLEQLDADVTSGAEFSLVRYRYDLPTGFAALAGPITFDTPSDNMRRPLQSTHESTIRLLYMSRISSTDDETPTRYAIYAKPHDLTAVSGYVIELFPPPQYQLSLRFMYRAWPPAPDSATNIYIPGGEIHSQTILEAILSEAETMLNTMTREWAQKFEIGLQRSIAIDNETAAPEFMPAFRNPDSDQFYAEQYDEGVNYNTLPGYVIPEGYESHF